MAPLEACGEPCIHVYPGKAGMLRALDGRLRGGFSSINPGFRGPKTRDIPGDFSCRGGRVWRLVGVAWESELPMPGMGQHG